jgi:hypothetical protein
MPNRLQGPVCSSRFGTDWIDDGTMVRQRNSAPGVLGRVTALYGPFDQHFRVLDSRTGQPMANTPYRIRLSSGREFRGVTDLFGQTRKVGADQVTTATLEIPYHGNSSSSVDPGKQYDTCCR